jgi:4-diphosphocytidyl-2-C-methyl-D-erythritol kinase
MLVFPNAKINLGLSVVDKRPDGLHNIKSCFYPVPWFDALEVNEDKKFKFTSSGHDIPGSNNFCITAYKLLKQDFNLPAVNIHLHKNIPIGAGLGGGSADGTFMLSLLNEKFSLALSALQLKDYASQLGSDCPFFVDNMPMFVEGTGDVLTPISVDLKGLYIAIIYPQIHIDTKSAYANIIPSGSVLNLKSVLENSDYKGWKGQITNDFEKDADPRILQLKDMLYVEGALYTSMTGSGSAVYGLFANAPDIQTKHPSLIAQL